MLLDIFHVSGTMRVVNSILFGRRHQLQPYDYWCSSSLIIITIHVPFYRATACNATHGIAVAILSVRPSVRHVYCDKTKRCTADILIPHETAITLVF